MQAGRKQQKNRLCKVRHSIKLLQRQDSRMRPVQTIRQVKENMLRQHDLPDQHLQKLTDAWCQ